MERERLQRDKRKLLELMSIFRILIVVLVLQVSEFIKMYVLNMYSLLSLIPQSNGGRNPGEHLWLNFLYTQSIDSFCLFFVTMSVHSYTFLGSSSHFYTTHFYYVFSDLIANSQNALLLLVILPSSHLKRYTLLLEFSY